MICQGSPVRLAQNELTRVASSAAKNGMLQEPEFRRPNCRKRILLDRHAARGDGCCGETGRAEGQGETPLAVRQLGHRDREGHSS